MSKDMDATARQVEHLSAAVAALNANIDQVLGRRAELEGMTAEVDTLHGQVGGLVTYGRRNRRLIRWLAVSVALDVLLSLGLGAVAWRAQDAAARAKTATSVAHLNANNAHTQCLAGNEYRAADLALWTHLLALPPATKETAAQQKTRRDFVAFVNLHDAPRDCDKVAPES